MIKRVVDLLEGSISRGEPLKLHELVWTIDASQHAIVSVDEINEGLVRVEGIAIRRTGDLVELVPDRAANPEKITDEDLKKAMLLYQRAISGDE